MASPKLDITGVVHAKPTPRKDKKGNEYPQIIVETERGTKFAQLVPFDCKDDIARTVDVGDEVSVSFNVGGREWKNPDTGEVKYFGSLKAWKVDITKRAGSQPPPEPNGGAWGPAPDDDNGLPF